MDKELLEQIALYLKSIKNDIPNGVDIFDVEKKLDKLIEIQEKQLDISEQILEKLENIYQEIPSSEVSLDGVEGKIERLIDKVDSSNDHLRDISGFTSNIS